MSTLAAASLEDLVRLCRSHGVAVSIAVYPWPRQAAEGVADNPHVRFWRAFARERRLPFLDLFPLFMDTGSGELLDRYYLPNDVHFNEAGHARIAEEYLRWRAAQKDGRT